MRYIQAAGAAFALAAVALTGAACGGDTKDAVNTGARKVEASASSLGAKAGQKAGEIKDQASQKAGEAGQAADNQIRGLLGVAATQASVRAGNFCSDEGSAARTADGKAATCVKKAGESRARWQLAADDAAPVVKGTVRVGNFCSDVGAIGQTAAGKEATCVKLPGESRARWGEAKPGTVTMPGKARPGAFCAPQGASGNSAKSVAYKCGKKSGERQARWRQ